MLVDNKFIFISLPRCASTSFLITCVKSGITLKHVNKKVDKEILQIDRNLDNEEMADAIMHGHEKIEDLSSLFNNNLDFISIKRDRHERFISLWKHVIDEVHRIKDFKTYEKFKKLGLDDLLDFRSNDLVGNNIHDLIARILKENNIEYGLLDYIKNMLFILYKPTSYWHNHDPRIKWFDIKDLSVLEDWVSNKIERKFSLEKINSSQHFQCSIDLNEKFIERYNSIYDTFDFPKSKNTII